MHIRTNVVAGAVEGLGQVFGKKDKKLLAIRRRRKKREIRTRMRRDAEVGASNGDVYVDEAMPAELEELTLYEQTIKLCDLIDTDDDLQILPRLFDDIEFYAKEYVAVIRELMKNDPEFLPEELFGSQKRALEQFCHIAWLEEPLDIDYYYLIPIQRLKDLAHAERIAAVSAILDYDTYNLPLFTAF
jgi:hypothetical protein